MSKIRKIEEDNDIEGEVEKPLCSIFWLYVNKIINNICRLKIITDSLNSDFNRILYIFSVL